MMSRRERNDPGACVFSDQLLIREEERKGLLSSLVEVFLSIKYFVNKYISRVKVSARDIK